MALYWTLGASSESMRTAAMFLPTTLDVTTDVSCRYFALELELVHWSVPLVLSVCHAVVEATLYVTPSTVTVRAGGVVVE